MKNHGKIVKIKIKNVDEFNKGIIIISLIDKCKLHIILNTLTMYEYQKVSPM